MPHLAALISAPQLLAARLQRLAPLARSVEVVHGCGRAYDEHAEGLCPRG